MTNGRFIARNFKYQKFHILCFTAIGCSKDEFKSIGQKVFNDKINLHTATESILKLFFKISSIDRNLKRMPFDSDNTGFVLFIHTVPNAVNIFFIKRINLGETVAG